MPSVSASLVDILREFVTAHGLLRQLAARFETDELSFEELQELVGDGEGSALFRLKEKCHALFRAEVGSGRVANPREALFDLAIGSLFHEAMKFREDFYQREVYGPRVRALRAGAGEDADGLFAEFERILSAVSGRLEEGLRETQELMSQSWTQLRVLLSEHPENGFVVRFLIENRESVEELGPAGLDALVAEIHGDPAEAYAVAGRSYLASGHYDAARSALSESARRGGSGAEIERLCAYAQGMAAYLLGDYAATVASLGEWLDAGDCADRSLADLAHAAVSRIGQLAQGEDREQVVRASRGLLVRLQPSPAE